MKEHIKTDILIDYYKQAYFPMADTEDGEDIKFYKPTFRFIIPIDNFHCPKKLYNGFKKKEYEYKINNNFSKVINFCKSVKRKEKSTWINNIIVNPNEQLNKIGKCHSVECYENQILIGGLYGVHLGSCFFGESMFSIKKNASKYCLLYLLAILKKNKFTLLDSQFFNPHLLQFGAYEMDHDVYEKKLKKGLELNCKFLEINDFQEILSLLQSMSQRS